LRTKRIEPDGTVYEYVYNGSLLTQMTVGANTLYFSYDAGSAPVTVTFNGTTYFYATNLQGDIVAILDSTGTSVATYTYDAWGKILSVSGSALATLNPLRYRGYVYDNETGWYYLQSRYYNPQWGRFIHADVLISTGQGLLGYNMFAYCLNNPVNYSDSTGTYAKIWGELFKVHDFGAIHRAVQLHIIANKAFQKELFLAGVGRVDIFCPETHEVWEIKHGGSTIEMQMARMTLAENQAKKYMVNYKGKRLQLGHAGAFQGEFLLMCNEILYLITYTTPKPGVILYFVEQRQQGFNLFPDYAYNLAERKLEEKTTMAFAYAFLGAAFLAGASAALDPICQKHYGN